MTANAGYHAYNTGDVLTAAQVQYNIQNQTVMYFATTAARTTAISAVTVEGMVTYIPANGVEFYNGTAWISLSAAETALTTKGDLLTYSTAETRLPVGNNGESLVADSSTSTGLKWAKSGNFIGCRVTKTTPNQSISNNTSTNVTFDAETYDTDSFHSNTVNNTKMTIPAGLGGYYRITLNIGWDTNSSGRRTISIKRNGSSIIALAEATPATGVYLTFNVSTTYYLSATDTIEAEVYQSSGVSLDVLLQAERTFLQIERIGS